MIKYQLFYKIAYGLQPVKYIFIKRIKRHLYIVTIFVGANDTLGKIVSSMLVLLTLGALVAPAVAAQPSAQQDEVHFTKIVVEPSGPDMNFTLYFENSFFTRVFSIIFGAKVLQPSIEHMFVNFSNVTITSIDSNSGVAKVEVKNMAKLSDNGWYVYNDSTTLAATVDVVEVHDSDGKVVTLNNANALSAITNRLTAIT